MVRYLPPVRSRCGAFRLGHTVQKIVSHFYGVVESVTPSPRRPQEDVLRFRAVDAEGKASQYYELFTARTGTVEPGAYSLAVMLRAVPYSKDGKPASFLSAFVLSATPVS